MPKAETCFGDNQGGKYADITGEWDKHGGFFWQQRCVELDCERLGNPRTKWIVVGSIILNGIFQQPVFDCGRVHISEPAVVCS